jgi:hypothetical protein
MTTRCPLALMARWDIEIHAGWRPIAPFPDPGGEMGPYHYLRGRNFRPMGAFLKWIKMTSAGLIDAPEVPAR